MKFLTILGFFALIPWLLSCSTTQNFKASENDFRSPAAAVLCENLFNDKTTQVKTKIKEAKNKIMSRLEFVSELLPASASEVFWDTVVQLSNNSDSKIRLGSNEFVLTKNYSDTVKIHSTYIYDSLSNSFVISKIEYSNPETKNQLISNSPIDPSTGKFRSNLFVDVESLAPSKNSIQMPERIDYKVYEKVFNELGKLDLFTTYELNKLYKLSPSARSLKFGILSRARALRKFFTSNILNDYLLSPVKTFAVMAVSVAIISHVDFVKNIVSESDQTPNWVAPAVVKMAIAYPKQVQPELVTLIKRIEYQKKSENADASKIQTLSEQKHDLVQIDEADLFSIEIEPNTKKTYFFVTHQQESGTIDIYATEINPVLYPNLITYFKVRNKFVLSK